MWAWYILVNDKIKSFVSSFNLLGKKKYIIVIGLVGILLILISDMIPKTNSNKDQKVDYNQYVECLEKNTSDIISSINGVGKCKVMLTLCETDENVYGQNVDEKTGDSSISHRSEYALYENNNEDTPILIKQHFPKVMGVVVVCQGGDNAAVKAQIVSAVSSLFDIPSNKISVSKINL